MKEVNLSKKIFATLLAILCVMPITLPCTSAKAETTVYVTTYGTKYHFSNTCRGLNNSTSTRAIGLTEAQNSGYTPCSICANGSSTTSNDDTDSNLDYSDKMRFTFGASTITRGTDINVTVIGENQDLFKRTDVEEGAVCYIPCTCQIFDSEGAFVDGIYWEAGDFSTKTISTSKIKDGIYEIGGFVDRYVYHANTGWKMNDAVHWCTKGIEKTLIIKDPNKKNQALKVKAKSQKIKYSTIKKKKLTVKARDIFTISKAQGKITFSVEEYDKKAQKKITLSKSGNLNIKKGLKKGTYSLRVNVYADGNKKYNFAKKTVKLIIKVK